MSDGYFDQAGKDKQNTKPIAIHMSCSYHSVHWEAQSIVDIGRPTTWAQEFAAASQAGQLLLTNVGKAECL